MLEPNANSVWAIGQTRTISWRYSGTLVGTADVARGSTSALVTTITVLLMQQQARSARLIMCNAVVFGVVLILVLIAYCYHEEKDKLPKVSVFFMAFSSVDFTLDCLWVHERQFSSNSERFYFVWGLAVLAGTCLLNVIGTISVIRLENDRFDRRNFQKTCFGIYPIITILCFTNTDCLLLLPWQYTGIARGDHWIVEATGFPSRTLLYISFLRLLEDAGQSVVQALYLFETQGKDTLTVYFDLPDHRVHFRLQNGRGHPKVRRLEQGLQRVM